MKRSPSFPFCAACSESRRDAGEPMRSRAPGKAYCRECCAERTRRFKRRKAEQSVECSACGVGVARSSSDARSFASIVAPRSIARQYVDLARTHHSGRVALRWCAACTARAMRAAWTERA